MQPIIPLRLANRGADSLDLSFRLMLIDSIGIEADAPNGSLCVAYFDGKYQLLSVTMKKNIVESLEEKQDFVNSTVKEREE